MINWPESLVKEVAHRRVALFLGAGVSATAQDEKGNTPYTWSGFLLEAVSLVKNDENQKTIKELLDSNHYLLALQAIRDESDEGDFRDLLDKCFNNPKMKESDLHRILLDLDIPITITTNFDKIYEKYCESTSEDAYKVVNYNSNDLGDLLRSDSRLIIKAHGSINEINSMIFTRSEYHEAKKNHSQFYDILKAIFLTHTVIFIGCGMSDPDILLALEEVKITASQTKPHYTINIENSIDSFKESELKSAYNIRVLTYGPNHEDLQADLNELLMQVDDIRRVTP